MSEDQAVYKVTYGTRWITMQPFIRSGDVSEMHYKLVLVLIDGWFVWLEDEIEILTSVKGKTIQKAIEAGKRVWGKFDFREDK